MMKFKCEEEESESMCEESVKKVPGHLMTSRVPGEHEQDDTMSISQCHQVKEKTCCDEHCCSPHQGHLARHLDEEDEVTDAKEGHMNRSMRKSRKSWRVQVSAFALKSINPIRQTVESLKVQPNASKSFIPLSIGDPNFFGNLLPHKVIARELKRVMDENKSWGYYASSGMECAREAIAQYVSVASAPVTANDIYVTSGGSHALDLCISLLAQATGNILIPRPGFPLYQTLAEAHGVSCKFYELDPHDSWKINFKSLIDCIDDKTIAIVYNNPSNPCGAVYSAEHMRDLLSIAEDHCLPIIADEIYEAMVFDSIETPFVPIASLTTQVPVLSCRGLTKRLLVPGVRCGWVSVHDRHDRLGPMVRTGLSQLCQRVFGSNGLIQAALPAILKGIPANFFNENIQVIKENADLAYEMLRNVAGLTPIKPFGAMYIMVGVDMNCFSSSFTDDIQLTELLVSEESVFVLPGKCFDYPNYFRLVLTAPRHLMATALDRMSDFFTRHYQK